LLVDTFVYLTAYVHETHPDQRLNVITDARRTQWRVSWTLSAGDLQPALCCHRGASSTIYSYWFQLQRA